MTARGFQWERALYWIAAAHFLFLGLWLWESASLGPDQNDWYFIRLAGERFLDGRWSEIYGSADGGFFWRFPPYGLYPAALLAALPATAAYWLKAAVEIAATGGAVALLMRTLPRLRNPGLAVLLVFTSAPFAVTVNIGQNSGTLLFLIALGLWLAERRSSAWGFGAWGLLALKPTIGLGFGLLALARRRSREIAAIAAGALVVVLTSLPLASLWDDFVEATFRAEEIRAQYSAARQITILGFLDGAFASGPVNGIVWAVAAAALAVAAYRIWTSAIPFSRKAGAVVLLVVAANPYMSFYDSLLLTVPAFAWYGNPASYRDRAVRVGIGWLLAVAWLDQHLVSSYLNILSSNGVDIAAEPAFSVVGPIAAAWLVLETIDARRHGERRAGGAAVSPDDLGIVAPARR